MKSNSDEYRRFAIRNSMIERASKEKQLAEAEAVNLQLQQEISRLNADALRVRRPKRPACKELFPHNPRRDKFLLQKAAVAKLRGNKNPKALF